MSSAGNLLMSWTTYRSLCLTMCKCYVPEITHLSRSLPVIRFTLSEARRSVTSCRHRRAFRRRKDEHPRFRIERKRTKGKHHEKLFKLHSTTQIACIGGLYGLRGEH